MILSYVILIYLALLSFDELFCSRKRKYIRTLFGKLVFLTMAGLCFSRGGVAGDYVTYKEVFDITNPHNLSMHMNFMYEPIYSIIQLFVKAITDNFQVFCLVIGTICLFYQYHFAMEYSPETTRLCVGRKLSSNEESIYVSKRYRSIKDSELPQGECFYTVFFILWGLYRANIVTTRSSIALCICLYSTKYIVRRDFRHFFITMILAIGFHYSAAIFIPSYFIYNVHCSLGKKLIILIGGSTLLTVGIKPLADFFSRFVGGGLGYKIHMYLESAGNFMEGTGMDESLVLILLVKAISNMGILLIMGLYLWKRNKNDRVYEGYLNLYFVGCILYLATLTVNYAFARLSIYYNIFQVPMILYLISKNKYNLNKRILHWIFLFIYIVFRFSVNIMNADLTYFWQ